MLNFFFVPIRNVYIIIFETFDYLKMEYFGFLTVSERISKIVNTS